VINDNFSDSKYWGDAWVRHIEAYLSAPPRCGIWLRSRFKNKRISILECAGGSCRDARYLFSHGYNAVGSDFDEKTIKFIQVKYPHSTFVIRNENAFNFSLHNKSIDYVFHNGFWVCFEDEGEIVKLFKEQCRVSRRYAIALVHNKNNKSLVKVFRDKSERDDLYKIRFFKKSDLEHIVYSSGMKFHSIKFEKFGGPADILYKIEKYVPRLSPLVRWLVPRIYKYQPWVKVERIAMIVKLETN
jgi:hypothetical protein